MYSLSSSTPTSISWRLNTAKNNAKNEAENSQCPRIENEGSGVSRELGALDEDRGGGGGEESKRGGRQSPSSGSHPKKRRKVAAKSIVGAGGGGGGGSERGGVVRRGVGWDPSRITTETQFMMGAEANKAVGLGNARGRIYTKHPELFKYSGDAEDKQWLYERGWFRRCIRD